MYQLQSSIITLSFTWCVVVSSKEIRDLPTSSNANDLPKDCETISGPHSTKCLNALWKSIGCSSAGLLFPQHSPVAETAEVVDMALG